MPHVRIFFTGKPVPLWFKSDESEIVDIMKNLDNKKSKFFSIRSGNSEYLVMTENIAYVEIGRS